MDILTNQEFTYRQVPVSAYTGTLDSIKGNTLVFNQLVQNGDFADTSVWYAKTGTNLSVSSNIATVTVDADGDNYVREMLNMVVGHKYLYSIDVWADNIQNADIKYILFYGTANDRYFGRLTSANTWQTLNGIVACVGNTVTQVRLQCAKTGITNKYRNAIVIDLTQMFGAGKEPSTVDEFTSLFPLPYYSYNTGELVSFNGTGVKTTKADTTELDTLSLPISTYFPTGMKSAGSVYDELTKEKAITRIGAVDLGTLTWSVANGGVDPSKKRMYSSGLENIAKGTTAGSIPPNLLCPKYNAITTNQSYGNTAVGMTFGITGLIYVNDPDYESAVDGAAFKAAMNGVYLYYELATPTETDVSLSLTYNIEPNGTEELLPTNTANPSTSPILADITYRGLIPVSVVASPTGSGTITGSGMYRYGESVTITAEPNDEIYRFLRYEDENGTTVSTSSIYTFTVGD